MEDIFIPKLFVLDAPKKKTVRSCNTFTFYDSLTAKGIDLPDPIKSIKGRDMFFQVSPKTKIMLKNHIKMAWRTLLNNKKNSLINIGGLAMGMAVAILLGLWIWDELSFNTYHPNHGSIAHVMRHFDNDGEVFTGGESSPIPLAAELRSSFGNDFRYIVMSTKPVEHILTVGGNSFAQSGRFMQADAPDLLGLEMISGARSGLTGMNGILLSETLADKMFKGRDPMGETLSIDNNVHVKVTGTYRDIPKNSGFHGVSYIAPFELYASFTPWVQRSSDNWGSNSFPIYVQIADHTTFERVSARIANIMMPHLDEKRAASNPKVFLHPMDDWHLYSKFEEGRQVTSVPLKVIWLYGAIGIFVLLLACVNFVNLTTARHIKRAKEIGIRKAIGSSRHELAGQFLTESLMISTFSFALALLVAILLLPMVSGLADKELHILWGHPPFWSACMAFILFTSLLAGSYPALYLSSLNAQKALKGSFQGGGFNTVSRKVLVVFQFTVSIALILATIVVHQQIRFTKDRQVGYDQDVLLRVPKHSMPPGKYGVLEKELLQRGLASAVAESSTSLTAMESNNSGFDWPGKSPEAEDDFGTSSVSIGFGRTIGWELVAGRDFDPAFPSDSSGIIVNEAAVKLMGLEHPIGGFIRSDHWHAGTNFKILGVVRDMVTESPYGPVRPTFFSLRGYKRWMYIKIPSGPDIHGTLSSIKSVFGEVVPSIPFDYGFMDDGYALKFAKEVRLGKTATFFGILAVLISCLGLFGLSVFVTGQRTKEVGIRKVLGASVYDLWGMLSRDFLSLVVIANLIAVPLAYMLLREWLSSYQYRTPISWWMVLSTMAGALSIALITVSFQAVRTASANPVKSLRTE